MATLMDTSIWIDFTRSTTRRGRSQFVRPLVTSPSGVLAEPVVFELLRFASEQEAQTLNEQFKFLPMLPTPPDIWIAAAELGQRCRRAGIVAGPLDLLIATVAIHHQADLVTFDRGFERIASVSDLRVNVLERPTAE